MQKIVIKYICLCFIAFGVLIAQTFANIKPAPTDALLKQKAVLNIMHQVADWQLNQWNTKGFTHPPVDWTNAACYTGIYALGAINGNDKYLDALVKIGTDLHWQTGPTRFMADDYCIGQTYSLLSIKYHDKKMIQPFVLLADSIINK
ncbi:MAG: glycoside hydrolase family 88 protein, partial [Mucilaginibacter sp.]